MFTELLTIHSLDLLGVPRAEQNDVCHIHRDLWRQLLHLDVPDVLLLRLTQGETTRVVTLGDGHDQNPKSIFVPYHMIGVFVEGAEVRVERERTMPPVVSKIVIQPLDTEMYHCDIASSVSAVLGQWNVIHPHTTFTIPCQELGGYEVDVFVKELEPAGTCCLLRGEVPLDLAEPLQTIEEFLLPGALAPSAFAATVPTRVPTPPVTARGTFAPSSMFADEEEPEGFRAFSGKGYSLR